MIVRTLFAIGAISVISVFSGCSTIDDDDVTDSRFGTAQFGLSNLQTALQSNSFGTARLTSGTNDDGALAVVTLSTLTPGTPISSPTITYNGNYTVIGIDNIDFTQTSLTGGFITGNNFSDTGTLTLTANLAARTLTGSDGTLTLNGTFAGTDLNGDVNYDGQSGALDGRIFEEGGYGGFHGNNEDRIFAGGLTFED